MRCACVCRAIKTEVENGIWFTTSHAPGLKTVPQGYESLLLDISLGWIAYVLGPLLWWEHMLYMVSSSLHNRSCKNQVVACIIVWHLVMHLNSAHFLVQIHIILFWIDKNIFFNELVFTLSGMYQWLTLSICLQYHILQFKQLIFECSLQCGVA